MRYILLIGASALVSLGAWGCFGFPYATAVAVVAVGILAIIALLTVFGGAAFGLIATGWWRLPESPGETEPPLVATDYREPVYDGDFSDREPPPPDTGWEALLGCYPADRAAH